MYILGQRMGRASILKEGTNGKWALVCPSRGRDRRATETAEIVSEKGLSFVHQDVLSRPWCFKRRKTNVSVSCRPWEVEHRKGKTPHKKKTEKRIKLTAMNSPRWGGRGKTPP